MHRDEGHEDRREQDEIDVTLIRDLLALTPAERFELLVESARNLMTLREKRQIL
ncbi:MAG TPA: hypothetical protein VKB93_00920 [Thermoanaerobaculia bacterium]|nr:hypothetical protein [Thermoanaerobaculia bacterium]